MAFVPSRRTKILSTSFLQKSFILIGIFLLSRPNAPDRFHVLLLAQPLSPSLLPLTVDFSLH
jgi:hypothetical protein